MPTFEDVRSIAMGLPGWVSVKLERIGLELLEKLVADAWRSTAPARLRGLLTEP